MEFFANGYKNLKDVSFLADPKMNIFCGENAQGKTNLMEAIWLCSGCRSFRGTKDKDFIAFDGDAAHVKLVFSDRQRNQEISFSVQRDNPKDKRVTLNGVKLPLMSKLFGVFKCISFIPDDLKLSKGAPDGRRLFLDLCVSQIKHGYVSALNKYENALSQRNATLKEIAAGRCSPDDLDMWDVQLADAGSYISVLRNAYTGKLGGFCAPMYSRLSKGKENLKLYYRSTVFESLDGRFDHKGELYEEYLQKLKSGRESDIRLGFTQSGTHRDDLEIEINGISVKDFGSQGQQRSAALVMKLSQAKILLDETGEAPVMLLDDVLSELDASRQDFVLNEIDGMQLFVTCCDPTTVLRHRMGKVFYMRDGGIIAER